MTAASRSEPLVGSLSSAAFGARLAGEGLGLRIGPFDFRVRSSVADTWQPLQRFYRDHPLLAGERVYSGHVALHEVRPWRAGFGRRLRFTVDGRAPHEDMPAGQGLAVLEWGINLVVALRFQCFLMLHAAVVERNGGALLLPAWPGHGKTTLCAALAHRGWRLFSDEFGLLRPGGRQLVPLPRPMPLKNESIQVLQDFAPEAELGPRIPGTRKGTVAHVKPPAASVAAAATTAPARWIVFPRWVAGAPLQLAEIPRAEGFMQLATNAFNYELLGEAAFDSVRGLVEQARCYRLVYSDLADAVASLTRMADDDAG